MRDKGIVLIKLNLIRIQSKLAEIMEIKQDMVRSN